MGQHTPLKGTPLTHEVSLADGEGGVQRFEMGRRENVTKQKPAKSCWFMRAGNPERVAKRRTIFRYRFCAPYADA